MKNKIINTLLFTMIYLGITNSLLAQSSDNQSKKIIDTAINHYKSKKNNYFKFLYGNGSNGKIGKNQIGIFYSTPSQYKLKIMETEQIFDGKKVYNISNDEQEITIAKSDGSETVLSPISYLNDYQKTYHSNYIGRKKINNILTDLIKLTPIKNNGVKYVNLYIGTNSKQIVKIEQYSVNNDFSVISVIDYKANQNLAKDMFIFDKNKYKNYLITEL